MKVIAIFLPLRPKNCASKCRDSYRDLSSQPHVFRARREMLLEAKCAFFHQAYVRIHRLVDWSCFPLYPTIYMIYTTVPHCKPVIHRDTAGLKHRKIPPEVTPGGR